MIKVSVIIPVYKVEQYIGRCLKSVMNQTCSHAEIECILVNDCTPDGSMQVIERCLLGYEGEMSFQVITHAQNLGLSAARNTGMDAAKGTYLYFLDSDDHITPDCLSVLMHYAVKYPQIPMIVANSLLRHSNKLMRDVSEVNCIYGREKVLRMFYLEQLPYSAWNRLVQREFAIKRKLYFNVGQLFEDVPWLYVLHHQIDALVFIPDVTYIYEDNLQSIVNTKQENLRHTVDSYQDILVYIVDHLDQHRLYSLSVFHLFIGVLPSLLYFSVTNPRKKLLDHRFYSSRRKLLKSAFIHCNVIILLYMVLLYQPFASFLRFSFFRHEVSKFHKLMRSIGSFPWW